MPELELVAPTEWGMPHVTRAVSTRSLEVIHEANVHHSDSEPPADHAGCAPAVRSFDALHRAAPRSWACLGYHRVICPHGVVFLGRSLRVVPAAALNHNTPIVAYCLIAKQGRATPAQWAALQAMAARDAHRIGRALLWSTHREVYATDCPGDAIQAQVDQIRRQHGPAWPPVDGAPVRTGLGPKRRAEADDLATVLERRQEIDRGRGVLRRLGRAIRKALR